MEASEIGPAIRAARVAAGMALVDVADRIGVSKAYVSYCERGTRIPSAVTLCALAEALPSLPLEEMLETVHRHQEEVRQKRANAAAKHHAQERAAKPETPVQPTRPRKRVHSLTTAQKLAAVTWAANQAGMSYGQFVARIRPDEYPGIYERYRAYLSSAPG